MPVKTYRCGQCGNYVEKLLMTSADEADLRCPFCNSTELIRSFWGQTVAAGSSASDECCMTPMGMSCKSPSAAPG